MNVSKLQGLGVAFRNLSQLGLERKFPAVENLRSLEYFVSTRSIGCKCQMFIVKISSECYKFVGDICTRRVCFYDAKMTGEKCIST